jgi:phenol hydroxylase P5 protein
MAFELRIEPLGQAIGIEDGQTVLDAALRAGIYLPHACCHGLCGTCKVRVLDGEVEHGAASSFALMDFEREEGACLACCASAASDLVIEADIDEEPDAQVRAVADYGGVVTRIEQLTPTIKAIAIRPDRALEFQAGQYVMLNLPGAIGARAFSLANPPGAAELELQVRRVPGGEATTYLHEHLKLGERLSLSGPYGRFFVRESADLPLIFIAGGSGLSSPRSMILDLLGKGFARRVTLVYGQRNRAELYGHADFLELAARHANFHYLPVLSDEPAGSAWDGSRGFVHDAARQHFGNDFRGHKAYLCGPPAMIEACITTLMRGRLFERDIYFEKFISAADAQQVRSPLFRAI